MTREMAYCGLDCALCKQRMDLIRERVGLLNEAFAAANIAEVSREIPFMRFHYRGYKKLTDFFSTPCPGCREGGGNPFCGIRKCAKKRQYQTCAECSDLCNRFKPLFRIHQDGEIQRNISELKKLSVQSDR